ncbi:hypothetical protein ACK3TF_003809 [Chlorella vulgaris]
MVVCTAVCALPAVAGRPRVVAPRGSGCQHCLAASVAGPARRCRRRTTPLCSAADDGGDVGSTIPDTLPVAGIDSDWRKFRAQLVASTAGASTGIAPSGTQTADSWAHALPHPEHGCLLLANPLMFAGAQQYFHMSVILVWAHDSRGSAGLILNRPTEYVVSHFGQGAGFLTPEFDTAQLYLGGDVGTDTVHLLHGIPGLAATSEIIPGVYLGGFEDAKRGVAEGRFEPEQFKILTRYAGWGPGQLEAECARGVWLPVSASNHAVLQSAKKSASVADMWHRIARLAGGDLAALSREVLGAADPDISRAAGGGYGVTEDEESESGEAGQHMARGGLQQQQRQRRGRLPEADYRDGAGI